MAFTLYPAVKDDFVDREEIITEIISTIQNRRIRMGFALVGQRRIGKSSIFRQATILLRGRKNIVPIYFSIWDLVESRIENFCKSFTREILESYREKLSVKYKIKQLVQEPMAGIMDFLKSINIHINVLEQIDISLAKKESEKDYDSLLEKVLLLPEVLASETGTRAVVFIDEFPSIMDLTFKNGTQIGEGILKKIRTVLEKYENTIFCISGSIRKTMELTLMSSEAPFFRQFIIKNIEPFSVGDVHLLLEKNLGQKVRKAVAEKICELTSGIPFYAQCIGRGLLRIRNKIFLGEVDNIFQDFLRQEGNLLFRQEFDVLSSGERQVIYAMAKKKLTILNEIAGEINKELNVVNRCLGYLLNKGVVEKKRRGVYEFSDPVFKKWLAEILS